MKIGIFHFSGTEVTALVARSAADRLKKLGLDCDVWDITPFKERERAAVDDYDRLIFGFPVYGDFAPEPVNQWLLSLEGRGRKCVLFCTYGGVPADISTTTPGRF